MITTIDKAPLVKGPPELPFTTCVTLLRADGPNVSGCHELQRGINLKAFPELLITGSNSQEE